MVQVWSPTKRGGFPWASANSLKLGLQDRHPLSKEGWKQVLAGRTEHSV
jgi:hypothetical protein